MESLPINESSFGPPDGGAVSPLSEGMKNLADCEDKAQKLFEILEAESRALRKFDSALLLQLVSQKEYSLNVLRESLRLLEVHPTVDVAAREPGKLRKLKGLLSDINRLNQANAVFIEGALEYCRDLLGTLTPTAYGQSDGSHLHRYPDCRGVTLKKKA